MNVRPDLEQTLVPFFDFDAYTRSLLLLARHRVLNEGNGRKLWRVAYGSTQLKLLRKAREILYAWDTCFLL